MAKKQPLVLDIGSGLSLMIGLPTITSWDTKTRPENPKKGVLGFNSETSSLEYWDGTSWFSAQLDKV